MFKKCPAVYMYSEAELLDHMVCMYVCVYACVCVCIYACVSICVHVCICLSAQPVQEQNVWSLKE